eukprot:1394572-Amorphochlora_amoeboformis.AAC.1
MLHQADNDVFDEFKQEKVKEDNVLQMNQLNYAVAFALSVLPVFIFYSVYKLSDIAVVYVVVTAISTLLLATAYGKVTRREYHRSVEIIYLRESICKKSGFIRLWGYRKDQYKSVAGMSQGEYDQKSKELTYYEAMTFSLFRGRAVPCLDPRAHVICEICSDRNNLVWTLLFLFFSFYAFREINREFCYAVSVAASSVLVWKLTDWV